VAAPGVETEDLAATPAFRAVVAGLNLAERLTPKRFPAHDPAALMRAARVSPPPGAIQGLVELHDSLAAESELTMFGRLSVRWDFIRLLKNAELVLSAHRENPALAAPVPAPIFILGLPRSGTTFLHALLAEDAGNLVPRNWQTIYPAPRPPDFSPAHHARARKVDRQLKLFAGLAPEFPAVHPVTADSPQECSEITAHVFQSLRFDTTFRVPAYRSWLDARGHGEAFAFHKQFLQLLQAGQPGRWVLKCPDHIFSMDAILQTYPDARFIVVHRDPVRVFGSVAHLTGILRRPFVKNVDPADIGAQVTERWIEGAERLVAFDRREDLPGTRKIHIHYHDLVGNPEAMVERIYGHFGLPESARARAAMRAFLAARPRGGYGGQRRYALGKFGINPDSLGPRFAGYLDYFGIVPQAAA
jgi:hypothetical protein